MAAAEATGSGLPPECQVKRTCSALGCGPNGERAAKYAVGVAVRPGFRRAARTAEICASAGLHISRNRPSPAIAEANVSTNTSPSMRCRATSGWSAKNWPSTVPPMECPAATARRRRVVRARPQIGRRLVRPDAVGADGRLTVPRRSYPITRKRSARSMNWYRHRSWVSDRPWMSTSGGPAPSSATWISVPSLASPCDAPKRVLVPSAQWTRLADRRGAEPHAAPQSRGRRPRRR